VKILTEPAKLSMLFIGRETCRRHKPTHGGKLEFQPESICSLAGRC